MVRASGAVGIIVLLMLTGLIRFALIWGLSRAAAPYMERGINRLLAYLPATGVVHDVAVEVRDRQSTTLIRSFGEAAGEMVFGPKKR